MQAVLDGYLAGYNTRRPHHVRGMNGRIPVCAFTERTSDTSNKEVTNRTKAAMLKAA